jgi:membrane protein implicated in regulation of membrane protease activity
MAAWIWLVLGIAIMMMELMFPCGFFLFILGSAGILVGALSAVGLVSGWVAQAALFCFLAVGLWLLMGKRLQGIFKPTAFKSGQVVGSIVTLSENIAPGASGSGMLWGTQWRVENVDSVILNAGSEVVVVSSQGIGLQVKRK